MIFERRLKPHINVDLTPLIDVVFQLVIFFMISSVFNTAPGITLELPESATSENVEITELRLTVQSDENIFVNKESCTLLTLEETLITVIEREHMEAPVVVLDGNKDIPYQLMIEILDILRRQGFDGVNLVTSEKSEDP
ncbi:MULTISPECIES: biopolymer transporter ExbD [unclassified Oceanispirochaeta]|uniref:ExbD/TolR family protein n=1 Tax=unclassified Oceanispirochaeta TaxID=2635722 RepID=UPI000E09C7A9|nr:MULTISPECIES: biopolymer transporter ExbD [unclassified Oceanispirochaeta]MBF9017164.1 biopolymer transporter ExbD [Oceanispirochaeta sp. M2]NPD73613.1 biopolymer transporter ExbD [Oceanispirochaeta sp. M1]RDG30716.1 biopolymer transporter ExbD [Oceanispirochaeta sp. M1]